MHVPQCALPNWIRRSFDNDRTQWARGLVIQTISFNHWIATVPPLKRGRKENPALLWPRSTEMSVAGKGSYGFICPDSPSRHVLTSHRNHPNVLRENMKVWAQVLKVKQQKRCYNTALVPWAYIVRGTPATFLPWLWVGLVCISCVCLMLCQCPKSI